MSILDIVGERVNLPLSNLLASYDSGLDPLPPNTLRCFTDFAAYLILDLLVSEQQIFKFLLRKRTFFQSSLSCQKLLNCILLPPLLIFFLFYQFKSLGLLLPDKLLQGLLTHA